MTKLSLQGAVKVVYMICLFQSQRLWKRDEQSFPMEDWTATDIPLVGGTWLARRG